MHLTVNNIVKTWQDKKIVDHVSVSIESGSFVGIAGETGSGKTTLLRLIAGLEQWDAGDIVLAGQKMKRPDQLLIPGYREMAYMSQHTALMNHYRVHEMLAYSGVLPQETINDIVKRCNIEHVMQRWTHELSGGEKQRVALAFCMSTKPQILLLDEPFSQLDRMNKLEIMHVLKDLKAAHGITILMASHDASELMTLCGQLMIMKQGAIVQFDQVHEIYHRPVNAYCAGLLDDYSLFKKEMITQFRFKESKTSAEKEFVFIRPQSLALALENEPCFEGEVIKCSYTGAQWKLMVHTPWGICHLHSVIPYASGAQVNIKLLHQPDHFM